MEKLLPRALLLLVLLIPAVGAGRSDVCCRGTLALLPDKPPQCPLRLDAFGESSLHRTPTNPRKARAANPPAKKTSRSRIRLGALAQKRSRSPTDQHEDGLLFLEGEKCNRWIDGQVHPVETFSCPTEEKPWKLFCCGTCTASYCCSSRKKRLKQDSCPEVVKGPEDQETEAPTGPTEELGTVSILDFILIAVALSTSFSAVLCSLKWWVKWREERAKQRMANAQLGLVSGIQVIPGTGTPQLVQAASSCPDLLSLRGAESQNPSGNPIQEMRRSPAFAPGGEERETML